MSSSPAAPKRLVLIDNGYYNFYRFFATIAWYNYSPERVADAEGVPWLENPVFMKTFEKMWFQTIKKITKKFDIDTSEILIARDGHNVWRYQLFPDYKAHRTDPEADTDPHSPGPVFNRVKRDYYARIPEATVFYVDRAEADDIIAVAVHYLRATLPGTQLIIITCDYDLLQLSEPGFVELYQLKSFKQITTDDPRLALMIKVLAGDPSDNIPQAFKGCGKKTAARLAKDPAELERLLAEKGRSQFDLNRQLIDFDYIPQDLVEEIESLLDEWCTF